MAGVYEKFSCSNRRHPVFTPNEHQKYVMDYFPVSPEKGLLLYHKLGSGKTCSSIIIADSMLRAGDIEKVFVLSPGSLRQGWLTEYCLKCGLSRDYLRDKFVFITYNYDVAEKIEGLDFNNSLVIIDEVHNLIRGVKNDSKTAITIYNKIRDATCRILALSGTPLLNRVDMWYLLGNLLKPGAFQSLELDTITDEQLQGIISYYPGDTSSYPEVFYPEPIEIKTSQMQGQEMRSMFDYEFNMFPPKEELKHRNLEEYIKKMTQYIVAKKFTLTRSISNVYYPEELKKIPDTMVADGGWVSPEIIKRGIIPELMSRKFFAVIYNISQAPNSKHVVYTFFKKKGGVILMKSLLALLNIKAEIFSGDLTDNKRMVLLDEYNSRENSNGENITVLLVTEAGAEGINLLEVNDMHILESSTDQQLTQQAMGRVIRYRSHVNLPPERQYVNIWRYWSVAPDGFSIDKILYEKGLTIQERIEQFTERLIANSIESR